MVKKDTKTESEFVVAKTDSNGNPNTDEKKVELKPVDHDFGRDDLNELRDKLNELIKRANA